MTLAVLMTVSLSHKTTWLVMMAQFNGDFATPARQNGNNKTSKSENVKHF